MRDVAPLVRKTCSQLARHTSLEVVCPPLVPKTRIVAIDGLSYPAGGAFGSHLAALVRSGHFFFVASIHGYDDARACARMAVAMALIAA